MGIPIEQHAIQIKVIKLKALQILNRGMLVAWECLQTFMPLDSGNFQSKRGNAGVQKSRCESNLSQVTGQALGFKLEVNLKRKEPS